MNAWYHDGDSAVSVDSVADAQSSATGTLDDFRDHATVDGWDISVELVGWGLVIQTTFQTDTGLECPDCGAEPGSGNWSDDCTGPEPTCDYQLMDVPDLAASIVEVLSTRHEVAHQVAIRVSDLADLRATIDQIRRAIGLPEGATTEEIALFVEGMVGRGRR